MLLVVAWAPTPALGEPLGALIFAALVGVGLYLLRCQVMAEATARS